MARSIDTFALEPGTLLMRRYRVVELLGAGWEGEVYRIREQTTGIERAAKLFFPQRNRSKRASTFYARKLHKLRHCPLIIQYHGEDTIDVDGVPVTVLISEYVDGEPLSQFLAAQPGQRLPAFQALHLLYELVTGLEIIHHEGESHGDIHLDNVIVGRYGLHFELKLLDLYRIGGSKREQVHADICDAIRLFYDVIGGQRMYRRQPDPVRYIVAGLKRSLISQRFKRASQLREYIEQLEW